MNHSYFRIDCFLNIFHAVLSSFLNFHAPATHQPDRITDQPVRCSKYTTVGHAWPWRRMSTSAQNLFLSWFHGLNCWLWDPTISAKPNKTAPKALQREHFHDRKPAASCMVILSSPTEFVGCSWEVHSHGLVTAASLIAGKWCSMMTNDTQQIWT